MPDVGATLRLQFHSGFTLHHAIPLIPYFKKLGITHIYSSPLLKARKGSNHGYDIVDPTCINPEIGGEPALLALVDSLRQQDMGLIMDIVANHMAVTGNDNPWWLDVMRWGLKSPYAHFFDIQWNSPDPLLKGQLLLPFLRAGYGEVLAAGEINICFDDETGEFYARHFEHHFPLYPPSYNEILATCDNPELLELGKDFLRLETSQQGWREAIPLHQKLRDIARQDAVVSAINGALAHFDIHQDQVITSGIDHNTAAIADLHAGDIHPEWQVNKSLQRLHELLELQHYRLASWTTAADDINWRRFFDVNELGGLRVERADVFEATHIKIFELVEKGLIDGLRVDHIDGLANPRAYCRKLRRRINRLISKRPAHLQQQYFPIYVEKILGENETLIKDWQADGTTGYEFMNLLSLVQHDPAGESSLKDLWRKTSGRTSEFNEEVIEARRFVLTGNLAGDVEMVAQGLLQVARTDIATRDLTLGAIRRALIELVTHFSVYRTYASSCGRSVQDQRFFQAALLATRTTLPEMDWPLLDYLDRWLGGQSLTALPPGKSRKLRQKVLARFQQLTSPAAAKAVEDTACYRSAVLLSRNDVGFDPQNFWNSIEFFHQQNSIRREHFPRNMLTTATHDHKRGEDTRARLAILSEKAEWFRDKVQQWQPLAACLKTELNDGPAPSGGDELILYQNLLGSWPLDLDADDQASIAGFLERLLQWQEKANREAKLRTYWNTPNDDYDTASRNFLTILLTDHKMQDLRRQIIAAANSIAPAGAINSLAQTLLRMTAPGIADLYQGNEFWDFSFVDPDNRRPVDYALRVATLDSLARQNTNTLINNWRNGQIKQWLIQQTLNFRQQHSELFIQGDYQILAITGKYANNIIAFGRHYKNTYVICIVPRLIANLLGDCQVPLIPAETWEDTKIVLPEGFNHNDFKSVLSDSLKDDSKQLSGSCQLLDGSLAQKLDGSVAQDSILVREALASFPVNLLCSLST